MANPALIHPIAAAVGATRAAAAWAWRRYKAAALDGVYPGSPEHQAALKSVEDRTAPQFTYWPVPAGPRRSPRTTRRPPTMTHGTSVRRPGGS